MDILPLLKNTKLGSKYKFTTADVKEYWGSGTEGDRKGEK